MKKIFALIMSLMLTISMMPSALMSEVYADSSLPELDYGTPGEDYEPGQVIVCVEGGTQALVASGIFSKKATQIASANKDIAAETFDGEVGKIDGEKIEIDDTLFEYEEKREENSLVLINSNKDDISSLIEELEKLDCVKFAEPNAICETQVQTPTGPQCEPCFDWQWYLDNEATDTDYDMNATTAFDNMTGDKEVVVAIMDTGVDYEHEDLKDSMWTANPTQFDATGNGGSAHGYPDEPMDEYGHGTHCASIIASSWTNGKGTAGVNGAAKIMACNWMPGGSGATSNWVEAMEYVMAAKDAGVNVVAANNSWGPTTSLSYCGGVVNIIANEAGEKGIVSCFAAGNSKYDHDKYPNFVYDSPYIITVGAMQSSGKPADFSERGAHTVDVFAPGTQILAATSRSPEVPSGAMQPQYIPWIQPEEDNLLFEDFSDDSDIVSSDAYLIDASGRAIADSNFTVTTKNGYKYVDLSDCSADDNFAFELKIPFSGLSGQTSSPYFAFFAGLKNALFNDADRKKNDEVGMIDIYDPNTDTWDITTDTDVSNGNYMEWRCRDENGSILTKKIPSSMWSEMKERVDKDGNIRIRMAMHLTKVFDGAEFRFDNIGFGTKKSLYYYSDGTSMATPCVAGVVSIIAGAMNTEPKTGEEAKEIIARVKGGVEVTGGLDDSCITQGCVQMDAAFKTESDLNPVPNSVTVSGDSATIKGYFFGNNQGSVTIAGRTATITSWSDRTITLTVPDGTKYTESEYIVTREDGKHGRNFAAFRLGQKEGETGYEDVPGYEEIPISDISYNIDGNTVKTEELIPIRMAVNDDGILVLLTDEEDESYIKRNKLQFYSFKTKQWSMVGTNNVVINVGLEEEFASIVGRGHKFYMLATTSRSNYPSTGTTYLIYGNNSIFTYVTTEDSCTCKRSKQVTDGSGYNSNIGSALGLGDSDKLYMAFGTRRTDTKIRELDPETGTLTIANNMGDLPGDYNKAAAMLGEYIVMAMPSAGQFLISGKNQIVAGIQSMLGRANEQQPGSPPSRAAVRNPNGTWKMSSASAFKMLDPEQSYNQNQLAAYGATDQGFIMAGPAQNIGTEDMVDTWAYMASSDSYVPLAPRVDSDRMRAQAGACYGGKFYVLGNSRARGNKLFLKYLDLSKVGLTSCDHAHDLHYHASSEPTCTASGNSEYWSCSSCSLYFSDASAKTSCDANSWIIPPKGHSPTHHASSEPTCTASGNSEYWSCSECGKYFSDEACTNEISADSWIISAEGHSLTHHASSAATCTASGNSEYWSCSECSEYFSDEACTEEISKDSWITSPLGHIMTEHPASAATCTASGNSAYWSCSACGLYFSDKDGKNSCSKDSWIISPTGHDLIERASSEPSCTISGNSKYWECSSCGLFFTDEDGHCPCSENAWVISPRHKLTEHPASSGDCTTSGTYAYWSCSECGLFFSDKDGKNPCSENSWIHSPTEHTLEYFASSEATCTTSGNSAYYQCTKCRGFFTDASGNVHCSEDSWIIPPKGHTLDHISANAATCTATGNSEYWSCPVCGKYFSDEACTIEISADSWIIAPTGHSLTHHASSAATCTASGNSEYWSCSACAKFFSDEDCTNEISADSWIISAEGHTLDHVSANAATTEKAGNKEYWHCTKCEKYFLSADATNECNLKDTILPKDNSGGNSGSNEPTVPDKCENHQFTKKVVDILPTDEKPGSYHLECPFCGETDGVQYRIYRLRIGIRKKVVYRNNISKLKFNIQGMSEGADYVVEYPTKGNKIGRHKAKIIFRGQFSELGARKVRYKVIPRGTKIKKLSSKNHRIIVTFAIQRRQTSGYQIRYSLNPNMKKSKKIIVTNHNKRRKQIRKLRNNRKYYIQVRTYKKVGTKKKFRRYFSKWSETESIKVKKNSRTVNNVVLRKLVDKIMSIGYNNTCR